MSMRTWMFGLGVTAVTVMMGGRPAAAELADKPLLVVVEAAPDADADAGEIRRAVATEVHISTVTPTTAASDQAERALIVGVERNRIAVELRDRYALPVARVIPAPAGHEARVRAIAWLAGNLVRDQVSGIVAEIPALAPAAEPPPREETVETPVARAPTEPPHYQPAGAISAQAGAPPESQRRWVLSLETGPVMGVYNELRQIVGPNLALFATLWRLELRRVSPDGRFFLGVSLEGTTGGYSPETLGAAGLCGWTRRHGPWAIEGSLGLGLDVGPRQSVPSTATTVTQSTTDGFTASTTVSAATAGGVYGAAAVAVSHTVGDAANLFLRLGAHVSTIEAADWFISSTVGVSYGVL